MMESDKKRKPVLDEKLGVNKILRGGSGSPMNRVFNGADSNKGSTKLRSSIGYIILAIFIFATVALLFTLLSEAGRFADTKTTQPQPVKKEIMEVIFTPKGTKAVADKDGNLSVKKIPQPVDNAAVKEGAAVPTAVQPSK